MRLLVWNLLLALLWGAVLGDLSLGSLIVGFVLGLAILGLVGSTLGSAPYFRKFHRLLDFAAYFLGQLVMSTVEVAADVVTQRHRARPGIVAVPLDARTDAEITLLANAVSLTPGSLSLEVSPDRGTLYVHVMFLDDADAYRRELKQGFERRVLELLR